MGQRNLNAKIVYWRARRTAPLTDAERTRRTATCADNALRKPPEPLPDPVACVAAHMATVVDRRRPTMEQRPTSKERAGPVPPTDPPALRVEAATLPERIEETRLELDALEREVAEAIAGRRAAGE